MAAAHAQLSRAMIQQTRGKAQVSQRHGANRVAGASWIAARGPQPTPQLAAKARLSTAMGSVLHPAVQRHGA
jgi:hypothetical protein